MAGPDDKTKGVPWTSTGCVVEPMFSCSLHHRFFAWTFAIGTPGKPYCTCTVNRSEYTGHLETTPASYSPDHNDAL